MELCRGKKFMTEATRQGRRAELEVISKMMTALIEGAE